MPRNPLMFLTSTLVSVTLVFSPMAAQAGGVSHPGSPSSGGLNCRPGTPSHPGRPSGGNWGGGSGGNSGGYGGGFHGSTINNINVYKPAIDNSKNTNVVKNIDNSKNVNVYKPVTINKNIDNSKNYNITKNIDNSKNININKNINNSKYIDNSKNININKNITINKGGSSEAEATALAAAIAAASANSSSNASVNFYGSVNGNSSSNASSSAYNNASAYNGGSFAGNVGSAVAEAPGMFSGGDFGSVSASVEAPAPVAAAAQQCTFQEATVIKAIHAVCVSADSHEFPASHMLGDTWIESSYEGEVARCLPGSHLKVAVGSVFQSSEGLASGWSSAQTLECGAHEAVRHFKGGMLKCAPAMPVPDCTERTNLRKYGTGDMFFTYRTKVCLETRQEYSQTDTTVQMSRDEELRGYSRTSSSY